MKCGLFINKINVLEVFCLKKKTLDIQKSNVQNMK